jgi:hypothetical protein
MGVKHSASMRYGLKLANPKEFYNEVGVGVGPGLGLKVGAVGRERGSGRGLVVGCVATAESRRGRLACLWPVGLSARRRGAPRPRPPLRPNKAPPRARRRRQVHRPTHFLEFATLEEADNGVDVENHFG